MFNSRRVRCFVGHLALSFVIFCVLMYFITKVWYPGDLFFTSGGWQGTKIVFFVDMVLGPTLTLIAASKLKSNSELSRDIAIISAIQVLALAYGVDKVIDNRPIGLAIYENTAIAILDDHRKRLEKSYPEMAKALEDQENDFGIYYVDSMERLDLSKPDMKEKAKEAMEIALQAGIPVYSIPKFFEDLSTRVSKLSEIDRKARIKIEELNYSNKDRERLLGTEGYLIPLDGSYQNSFIVLSIKGNIIERACCH